MNIRSLALDTALQIRKKQNWLFTKKSRIDAINTFEVFLKTNPSEEAILTAAKLALQGAKIDGYGRSGEKGSSFVAIMNQFIAKAELKIKENKEQQALAVKAALKRNVEASLQNTLSILNNLNVDLDADYKFEKTNQKRLALENNISDAFRKHHLNTAVRSTWGMHLSGIRNGSDAPSVPPFYGTYETLHPEVKDSIETYRSFLQASPDYLEALRLRNNKAAINQSACDIVLKHAMERKETRLIRAEAGIFQNDDLDREAREDQKYLANIQRSYSL